MSEAFHSVIGITPNHGGKIKMWELVLPVDVNGLTPMHHQPSVLFDKLPCYALCATACLVTCRVCAIQCIPGLSKLDL